MFRQYAEELSSTLARLPWSALERTADALHTARLEDRQVFIIGNGGSASTASHMACDIGKNTVMPGRRRFRVMALTDNFATFSALANDVGYENVFSEQLAHFVRKDDILIAISTSGESENILRAVRLAHEIGALTIGWTGFSGGTLARLVDIPVVIDNHCVEQIEDVHLVLEHMLTVALRRAIQNDLGVVCVDAERAGFLASTWQNNAHPHGD